MPATLGELAEISGSELRGDADCHIDRVNTLQDAVTGDITFLSNRHYARYLADTKASAVILSKQDSDNCKTNALINDDPYLAYARIINFLYPSSPVTPGIHASAIVGKNTDIAADAMISASVVIGNNVHIGSGSIIGPGVVIENNVRIGKNTRLLANNTVCADVIIGNDTILHAGAVVGSDGFGMAKDKDRWLKIPQIGSVIIGDRVEIGANTTIDRGAIGDTIIEDGVRLDNQIQIAHNVVIGENTAIAGCTAIAGSVTIGKRCMIGGMCAVAGHIEICDDVIITAMSGVPNSIKERGVYSAGLPITDNRTWRRNMVRFRNLDETIRKIQEKLD